MVVPAARRLEHGVSAAVPVTHLHWRAAGLSDRGLRRRRNEDALLVRPDLRLFAVADGMGGHAAGNIASRLAMEALTGAFPSAPSPRIGGGPLSRRLMHAFEAANDEILAHATSRPSRSGMGTTLTCLAPLVSAPGCVIAHMGDSRAYVLRAGTLTQVTCDHTWVQQQVDAGMLTPAQARHHPLGGVLSRVLGTHSVGPADTMVLDACAGDRWLLCSDGLTNLIEDDVLRELLSSHDPDGAVRALVDAANAAGGMDNITAVVCDVLDTTDPVGAGLLR